IVDLTRHIASVVLFIHCYYYCYVAFSEWGLVSVFTDRLLANISRSGLFGNVHLSKLVALGFLFISLFWARGRKNEKLNRRIAFAYIIPGLLTYFISYLVLWIPASVMTASVGYMALTVTGFLLMLSGGTLLSRIIKDALKDDIFNEENETFPQEERLLENEYSINLPAEYQLKR